jgi:hypothetical protein
MVQSFTKMKIITKPIIRVMAVPVVEFSREGYKITN